MIAFISLFTDCTSAAGSLSYGPNSCGHGFQGVEVYLNNHSPKAIRYTIKITTTASDNTRRESKRIFDLSANDKRYIGCTKGNFFPPLTIQYQVIKREELN